MATMEAPATTWSIDANYGMELDSLLDRIVEGHTTTEMGLRNRVIKLAEAEQRLYTEVKLHLGLRFAANRKGGGYDEEKIAKIPPVIKSFLGLNVES